MSERLSVTLPRAPSAPRDRKRTWHFKRSVTVPVSNAALQCRHVAPSSPICLFSRLPPPERSCFTKRLVNISVRTRRKRRRGGEGGGSRKTTNDKRKQSVRVLYLLHLSESVKGRSARRIMRNAASGEGSSARFLRFLLLCLVFILLRITLSGGQGGVRRGESWEDKVVRGGKRWRRGGGGKILFYFSFDEEKMMEG